MRRLACREIVVEAGQLSAPELQAAAAASTVFTPALAPAEDEQWPVTITVCLSLCMRQESISACTSCRSPQMGFARVLSWPH